jgi:hypothetical protein
MEKKLDGVYLKYVKSHKNRLGILLYQRKNKVSTFPVLHFHLLDYLDQPLEYPHHKNWNPIMVLIHHENYSHYTKPNIWFNIPICDPSFVHILLIA